MDVDELTLTGALLILNSYRSGFKSVTIPMDGVEVHKLSPCPLLWFRLCKNSFKKVVLLDINLGAPSYCKKRRDGVIRTVIKVLKKIKKHLHNATDIYTERIQYSPSFVNWHIVRLPWVTHPTVALQEEVTALPVAVGVWGFINNFKDGLPRDKTVHSL